MRIAVITSSYPRYHGDGTAPFVKSICEHLAKLGHEIEVVAPYDIEVKDDLEPQTVPVHRFRYIWPAKLHLMGHARSLKSDMYLRISSYMLLPFFLVSSILTLMRLTFHQQSEVIYAHWVLPNGLIAALVSKTRSIPLIISLHGSDIFLARNNLIFSIIARLIFKYSAVVTACSQELQQIAITLGAPNNTLLLPYGVDSSFFKPTPKQARMLDSFHRERKKIVVGSLGRFVEKKGFSNLISAFSLVIQERPDVELILAGDGVLREDLIQQSEETSIRSHVKFPGRIPWDETPAFLASLDLFVLPSIRDSKGNVDGLPNVLLEAMSCGIAVVASDIGGVGLVIKDYKNGIIIPPGNNQALAEAILYLINNRDKREEFGLAAREHVLSTLSWDEFVRRLSDLMESSLNV